jgi:hypothetical protein
MFLAFAFSCRCSWWKYSESEFLTKFNNSWDVPLYALCYSQNCPHCQGLPTRFELFAGSLGAGKDLLCTAIDINNTNGCRHLGATHLPYWVFVRGTNKKYWLYPSFNCPLRWMDFVADWVEPTARDSTKQQFEDSLNHTFNGGSAFYLELPETDKSQLQQYESLSAKYHVVNNSFAYSISHVQQPLLKVYRSEKCFQEFTSSNLNSLTIIEKYKFSAFHHYDAKEWTTLSNTNKTVLVMIDEELNGNPRTLLYQLSRDYCASHEFGWARIGQDKAIGKALGKREDDPPYVVVSDNSNQCRYVRELGDGELEAVRQFIDHPPAEECLKFEVKTGSNDAGEVEKRAAEKGQENAGAREEDVKLEAAVAQAAGWKTWKTVLGIGVGVLLLGLVVVAVALRCRPQERKLE